MRGEATKSCGCLVTEMLQRRNTTHGKSQTKGYRSWTAMKRRCYNRNTLDYSDYGGRGITVCDRWRDDFTAFLEDMGEAPGENHSIDRIDNNGPYKPENCCWSDINAQANNRRNNKSITYEGVTYPSINAFCREHNVSRDLLKYYRNDLKLPLEEAVRRTYTGQGTGGKSQNRFKQNAVSAYVRKRGQL